MMSLATWRKEGCYPAAEAKDIKPKPKAEEESVTKATVFTHYSRHRWVPLPQWVVSPSDAEPAQIEFRMLIIA